MRSEEDEWYKQAREPTKMSLRGP